MPDVGATLVVACQILGRDKPCPYEINFGIGIDDD
jgi:ABC-type enterochelin transport system permease subunit